MNYEVFNPPIPPDFYGMSRADARRYYDWFCHGIPFRMQVFGDAIQDELGLSTQALTYSRGSLTIVGDWYQSHISVRPKTETELGAELKSFPSWMAPYVSSENLTDLTISLAIDLGIYFGCCLQKESPWLRWELLIKPKNSINYQQPVLVPFTAAHMNPVRVALAITYGALDRKEVAMRLCDVFDYWSGLVSPDDDMSKSH